jgi:hypothetical protein
MNKEEETYLLDRVWRKKKNVKNTFSEVSKFPYIFLTNAPLTFGHSQLVVPTLPGTDSVDESKLFRLAAPLIEDVLKVFEIFFVKGKRHTKAPFQKLAEDTYSYGKYIKTLILRTSADDDPKIKIKFHLVPYFESNQVDCHKRFHSLHRAPPDKKGGMIGWLGERETQLDNWLVDGFPGPITLDQIGRDVWKLPELAKRLERIWLGLANNSIKGDG